MTSETKRVIVMIQENHTTDNYLRDLAAYGVNVATDWPTQPNPPLADPRHDRESYYKWLTTGHAARSQFATKSALPFYAYLGLTGALLENHCSGFGTNSTPNHLLLLGGQSPTLKNPSSTQPPPLWDMPSVPGQAEDAQMSWACYTGESDYPAGFYKQLKGSPNWLFAVEGVAGVRG